MPPAVSLFNFMIAVLDFRGFFPKMGFFEGFSLYIINFAGRISEAATGGAGGAQRSALFFTKPKKTGVCSSWAHMRGKNPLIYLIKIYYCKNKFTDFYKSYYSKMIYSAGICVFFWGGGVSFFSTRLAGIFRFCFIINIKLCLLQHVVF